MQGICTVLIEQQVIAENSSKQNAGIAQSVVRRIGSAEVTSSILVASSQKSLITCMTEV